jgi:hypothetical protein
MGKAADNETIKLTAAFWNNLSVGMSIGGVFVAYLALFQRVLESRPTLEAIKDDVFQSPDVRKLVGGLIAIALALGLSAQFRRQALREIAKIQD